MAESDGERAEDSPEGGTSVASGPEEGLEFEDAVSELESVESGRRKLFAAFGVGFVVLLAGSILYIAEFTDWFFQPKMPIEETRREIVRKTDDPQCRELIAEVTNIANTFFAMESRIEAAVPGGERGEIRDLDEKLATLKERLDDAEELGERANLRFEDSRKELDRWFGYVDNEIWVLRDVLENQLAELGPAPAADADGGASSDGVTAGDASSAVRADAGDATSKRESGPPEQEEERSPEERRSGALVALHDAFENFRVWHTANLHPCGDAAEDETPWRPEGWEPDPDAGSQAETE